MEHWLRRGGGGELVPFEGDQPRLITSEGDRLPSSKFHHLPYLLVVKFMIIHINYIAYTLCPKHLILSLRFIHLHRTTVLAPITVLGSAVATPELSDSSRRGCGLQLNYVCKDDLLACKTTGGRLQPKPTTSYAHRLTVFGPCWWSE